MGYSFNYYTDKENRRWLVSISGRGDEMHIEEGVWGISATAFLMRPAVKQLYIPASVMEIGESTFAGYDDSLTIYCAADKKPAGWSDTETVLDKFSDETTTYHKVLHGYWLGNAEFVHDEEQNLVTYIPYQSRTSRPKVVWGHK